MHEDNPYRDEGVMMTHSTTAPTMGKLAAAMARAQGEMETAKKDHDNPFFKSRYADLASCWDAIRVPFARHELAVFQDTSFEDGRVVVKTTIAHSSGEWRCDGGVSIKPVKDDPQAVGSSITYARRYGLCAMCGIAPDDDDGEGAMGRSDGSKKRKGSASKSTKQVAAEKTDDKAELKSELWRMAKEVADLMAQGNGDQLDDARRNERATGILSGIMDGESMGTIPEFNAEGWAQMDDAMMGAVKRRVYELHAQTKAELETAKA